MNHLILWKTELGMNLKLNVSKAGDLLPKLTLIIRIGRKLGINDNKRSNQSSIHKNRIQSGQILNPTSKKLKNRMAIDHLN